MQHIDNKLYIAWSRKSSQSTVEAPSMATRLARTTASERLSILVIGGLLAVAGPTLVSTVANAASLSLSVLVEFSHIGLVAFQVFGR